MEIRLFTILGWKILKLCNIYLYKFGEKKISSFHQIHKQKPHRKYQKSKRNHSYFQHMFLTDEKSD